MHFDEWEKKCLANVPPTCANVYSTNDPLEMSSDYEYNLQLKILTYTLFFRCNWDYGKSAGLNLFNNS